MNIFCLWGIARYYVQLVRQDRVAQVFFISLLLLITPLESSAGGNVAPILNTSAPPYVKYDGYAGLWDTPDEACRQFLAVSSWSTWGYSGVEPIGNGIFKCLATPNGGTSYWISNVLTVWSCDGSVWGRSITTCTRRECPANATGVPAINPTLCTCDENYLPDSAGTSCVPVTPCPISDLPPITDPEVQAFENNPDLSDTAHLDPQMRDVALPCLLTATADGSPSVGSAYRPPAYNQHLIDIWKKWRYELMDNENPACATLKAKIQGHFQRHKLLITQPPVPNSRHTRGLAVDVTISLPPANIDACARSCGLYRPKPVKDRVHFQFP